jgi:HPt (histidine-containing phosphotransfer) domain-containing protein
MLVVHLSNPIFMQSFPLYDLTMVQGMVGGNYAAMQQLVHVFLETVPKTLQQMQTGARQQDWEQSAKMAHKLKSAVNSLNIHAIKEDVKTIEHNGKNNINTAIIPVLVNKVETVMKQVMGQLISDYGIRA